ncbi:MAG: Rsd/AlgQ family anti-sigma factor [Candidatus Competibacteraceae bacterium]|jgi:regulator of sigma D|nr:Rsd/AlgQ family anti-sigma factor [Candidatus Competibacteraceae bacterium]
MAAEISTDPIHSKAIPDLINKLLQERQEMLVLFNRLAATRVASPRNGQKPALKKFCELLVDYIALGHFEVYQCIEDHAGDSKRCQQVKRLAQEFYPMIAETTEAAIAFSDHYTSLKQVSDALYADLSKLGEHLATRIELEDRLINAVEQQPKLSTLLQ